MPSDTSLRIQNLSVRYRTGEALRNVSFAVAAGQLVGVIGPNGAGKSTLLKALLGLVPVTTGLVKFEGRSLRSQQQRVAYVPQRTQIDWTYPATVRDVVLTGRTAKTGWFRPYSANSRRLAAEALERVGMADYGDRPIGQLSGGQQQRVFVARSLTQEADLFLLDEPFVGIDYKTQAIIFEILDQLAREGKTILVVNHDLGESLSYFSQVLLLNKTLIASGGPAEVITPDNISRAYGSGVPLLKGQAA
jgi:manganese/iron transport system ATP-binding protein